MQLIGLAVGREDYNNRWAVRVTLAGVSLLAGSNAKYWVHVGITVEWLHHGYWDWESCGKKIYAETLIECLVRRLAPGWRVRP